MTSPPRVRSPRRGMALIGVIVFLLVVGVIIVGMVLGGARDQDLTVRRLETVRAFYAAEGGMNMAIREVMVSVDEDADGAIGTISDDSDNGTDPAFGTGQVVVMSSVRGPQPRSPAGAARASPSARSRRSPSRRRPGACGGSVRYSPPPAGRRWPKRAK